MAHLGNENLNNEAQILIFSLYKMTNPISHCFLTIFLRKAKLFLLMCSSMCVCLGVCVHACIHALRGQRECPIFSSVSSSPYLLWWDLSRNLELDAG